MTAPLPCLDSREARRFRSRRLKLAVGTAMGGKTAGLVVQLVAIPLAVRALPITEFALYSALTALLGWLNATQLGLGPALVIGIAGASAQRQRERESALLTSALFPAASVILVVFATAMVGLDAIPVTTLVGDRFVGLDAQAHQGMKLLIGLVLLQVLLTVGEAARLGYQEGHLTNLWIVGGSLATAGSVIGVSLRAPSIINLILAANVPILLARLLNLAHLLWSRPYLIPRPHRFSWSLCRALVADGILISMSATLGGYLCHQFPVVMISRCSAPQTTATFAISMTVFSMMAGILTMALRPLLPALSDSRSMADVGWSRRMYGRIAGGSALMGSLVGLGFALVGVPVLRLWFGPKVDPSATAMAALGVYSLLAIWEMAHFTFLIGLGRIPLAAMPYIARSLIGAPLVYLAARSSGVVGTLAAMAGSAAGTTVWLYPILIRRALREQEEQAAEASGPLLGSVPQ